MKPRRGSLLYKKFDTVPRAWGICLGALATGGLFAGTFTWNGTGTTFSTGFAEGVPPTGDASVVLDFSGASAAGWTVENDLDGLVVNRIVLSANKGSITGEKLLTFAAHDGELPVVESKANADDILCPVALADDLTVKHLGGAVLNIRGLLSGTGRLIVRLDPASTSAAQPATVLWNGTNTFSGGTVVSAARCYGRFDGAFGTGPLWSTNTFTTKVGSAVVRSDFVQYGPATFNQDIYLENESYNGYASHFFVENRGDAGGPIVFAGKIHSNMTKITNGGANCPIRLRGGLDSSNQMILVCYGAPVYIDEPLDASDAEVWSGASQYPVVFNCTGNRLKFLCGFSAGAFRFDVDNAFANTPSFGPQAYGTQSIQIDLNGTTQVLGGHDGTGRQADATLRTLLVKNTSATPANLTITQNREDNLSSPLTFSGKINLVKDGPYALALTNTPAFQGSLTVQAGTLKLQGTPAAAVDGLDFPAVTLGTNALLDLGGHVWRCGTLAMSGGWLQNGELVPSAGTVTGGTAAAGTLGGSWTTGGDGSIWIGSAGSTGAWVPTQYTLPQGTVLYWSFDEESTALEEKSGTGLVLTRQGSDSAWKSAGKAGGCYTVNSSSAQTSYLKLDGIPSQMPTGNKSVTYSFWFRLAEGAQAYAETLSTNPDFCMFSYGRHNADLTSLDSCTMQYSVSSHAWKIHNYWNYSSAFYFGQALSDFAVGTWHHFVGTIDATGNGSYTVYVDGVVNQQTADLKGVRPASEGIFYLGGGCYGGRFWGDLDEFLVLDHAVDAAGAADLYAHEVARTAAHVGKVSTTFAGGRVNPKAAGLAFYLSFDDAAHPLQDGRDTPNVVTPAGAPVWSEAGRFGGCLALDGVDDYLTMPIPSDFPSDSGAFSIALWVKADADLTLARNFGYGIFGIGLKSSKRYFSYEAKIHGSTADPAPTMNDWTLHGYGDLSSAAGMSLPRVSDPRLMDGSWHQVVYVVDTVQSGKNTQIYFDGVCVSNTRSTGFNLDSTGIVMLGQSMYGSCPFKGCLDDVIGWTRALSALEVTQLYEETLGTETYTVGTADDFTVTGETTFYGKVAFSDGATWDVAAHPIAMQKGEVTCAGTGTLVLAAEPTLPLQVTLATGVQRLDAATVLNFASWDVVWGESGRLGAGVLRSLQLVDGVLTVRLSSGGTLLIFR